MKSLFSSVKLLATLFLLLSSFSLFAQPATPTPRIEVNGQEIWVNGTNLAWIDFARDLGPGSPRLSEFELLFKNVRDNGGNTVRFWMHTTGRYTPAWNGFTVTGPGQDALRNLTQILDLAESYDIVVLLSLWSFDMLRISNGETVTNRSRAILTQQEYRDSYIQNSLIPMVEHVKGHKAILAWEIFNEAEGMSEEFGWGSNHHVPMAAIQTFVNQTAGAIKRTDPGAKVTTGIHTAIEMSDIYTSTNPLHKNYYRDDRLVSLGGDSLGTLDFYTFHYYQNGDSPFIYPASHFELDKPVFLGEFFIKGDVDGIDFDKLYQKLYDNGYAGALSWQWVDWRQNRDGNTSTWLNTIPNLQHMYARYQDDIELRLSVSPATFNFSTERSTIERTESTLLQWTTRKIKSVQLNGDTVSVMGTKEVSPVNDSLFVLTMTTHEDEVLKDTLLIKVLDQLEVDRTKDALIEESSEGDWFLLELTQAYDFKIIEFTFGNSVGSPVQVQSSIDGINWDTIHTIPIESLSSDQRITLDQSSSGRFLRILGNENLGVTDVQIFGLPSEFQPPILRITEPLDRAEVEAEVELTIKAIAQRGTEGLGRSGVIFYVNGERFNSKRFGPYEVKFTPDTAGVYVFQIGINTPILGDFYSREVQITVKNTLPKTRYEAEDALRTGTIEIGSDANASEGAYAYMKGDGNLTWPNIKVDSTKVYTLRFGYNLPFDAKTQFINVNGNRVDTITFNPPTSKWQIVDRDIFLTEGTNVVEIVNSWGWMYFDFLEVRGSGQDLGTSDELEYSTPNAVSLQQNYPNPFNPNTIIEYYLPISQTIELNLYNILGAKVATIDSGLKTAGNHRIPFNASELSSGLYFYRLISDGFSQSKSMLIIK